MVRSRKLIFLLPTSTVNSSVGYGLLRKLRRSAMRVVGPLRAQKISSTERHHVTMWERRRRSDWKRSDLNLVMNTGTPVVIQ